MHRSDPIDNRAASRPETRGEMRRVVLDVTNVHDLVLLAVMLPLLEGGFGWLKIQVREEHSVSGAGWKRVWRS